MFVLKVVMLNDRDFMESIVVYQYKTIKHVMWEQNYPNQYKFCRFCTVTSI